MVEAFNVQVPNKHSIYYFIDRNPLLKLQFKAFQPLTLRLFNFLSTNYYFGEADHIII
ncbi:hypothetical protein GGQ60_002086 [Pedobacter zeae]|uniref:Uncharacterized protein n=1 Tax=Pedobacter zeae TaxID=1737356 RepID=A0A7W6KAA8_9SPHI|nr:hypothetical protein [Pedobacter zeae]